MEDDSITVDPLLGRSEVLRTLLSELRRVAPRDAPLLLVGPYGAGFKDFAAYAHAHSGRQGAFVRLPGLVLQDSFNRLSLYKPHPYLRLRLSIETNDYQHVIREMDYCLEQFRKADGGTLFLEELGDVELESQALLESILDGGAFRRYFPDEAPPDFRLIISNNITLERLVREGLLRASLYERLAGATLWVPGLRERGYDVVHVAREMLMRHPALQERQYVMDQSVEGYLFAREWEANLPELEKLIQNACLNATSDHITARTIRKALGLPHNKLLPGVDERLLETIGQAPRVTEVQLLERLGLPPQLLSARLRALTKVGRLRRAGRGPESLYFLPRRESG